MDELFVKVRVHIPMEDFCTEESHQDFADNDVEEMLPLKLKLVLQEAVAIT